MIRDLLAELGLPAVVVTHDFRDAAALSNRVAIVADGRVRQDAPLDELAAFIKSYGQRNISVASELLPDEGQ